MKSILKRLISPLVVVFAAIALLLFLGCQRGEVGHRNPAYPLDYSVRGHFEVEGSFPGTKAPETNFENDTQATLWASWAGDDGNTGELKSSAFAAPGILRLLIAGYPNRPNLGLYVEKLETGKRLKLQTDDPGEKWVPRNWFLPRSWIGRTIRLVAVDNSSETAGWLGCSSFVPIHWWQLVYVQLFSGELQTLAIPLVYVVCFGFWLLPGLAIAIALRRWHKLPDFFWLSLCLAGSCLLGYGVFWLYFLHHSCGQIASVALCIASLGYVVFQRQQLREILINRNFFIPLGIMFGVGLLYVCILYLSGPLRTPETLSHTRFFFSRPPDSIIPLWLADRLYLGQDPRYPPEVGWLSSDRPPLQTGIILFVRPLTNWLGISHLLQYQVLATIVQMSWVASIASLGKLLKLSGSRLIVVFGFSIASGFFLFNSLYAWPKLLAAFLIVFSIALILHESTQNRTLSTSTACIAATSAALGLLAHTGVAFTLIGATAALWLAGYFNPIRQLQIAGIGLVLMLGLLSPWLAYQKLYDPPGNNLVKFHFADAIFQDCSLKECIVDAYKSIPLEEAVKRRIENFKTVSGFARLRPGAIFPPLTDPAAIDAVQHVRFIRWRKREKEFLGCLLGVLNVGWPLLLVRSFSRVFRRSQPWDETDRLNLMLIFCGLPGIIISVLLLFRGETAIVPHFSFADVMLLYVGLAIAISKLPRLFVASLLTLQLVDFLIIWLLSTPPVLPNGIRLALNLPLVVASALIALLLAAFLLGPLRKTA